MDTISNMIIMIKNASTAKKSAVIVPYSKLNFAIAQCLEKEGFIVGAEKVNHDGRSFLEITVKYNDGQPKVNGVKRISKPSRRIYFGFKDIKLIKQGFGAIVLSTPKGIMSGKEAKKELVGGEALFEIW